MPKSVKKNILQKAKEFLVKTETPIWFLIVSAFVASILTYCAAPHLNEKFEENRVRSELVLTRAQDINASTRKMFSDIQSIYSDTKKTSIVDRGKISQTTSTFSSLQWRAIELGEIASDADTKKILIEYQQSLLSLKQSLEKAETEADLEVVLKDIRDFAEKSNSLNTKLYKLDFK